MKQKTRARARRVSGIQKVKKIIEKSAVVLEVIDARDISGTRSLFIEKYAENNGKVLLFVINKSDLVPKKLVERGKRELSGLAPTYYISARNRTGIFRLKQGIMTHAKKLPVRVSIVGYPNVGKSQLANALKGRRAAKVAPLPGETKGVQWVSVSTQILLLDSPGIIPLKDTEESLALKGAISPDKLKDPVHVAVSILDLLKRVNKERLLEVYGLETKDLGVSSEELIKTISRKRGRLFKGGEPDIETTAKQVLRDWYNGKISRYSGKKEMERNIKGKKEKSD